MYHGVNFIGLRADLLYSSDKNKDSGNLQIF